MHFTALNQCGDSDDDSTFTFDGFLDFTDGETCSDDVFANEHTLFGLDCETSPPFHAAINTFREGDGTAEIFADFVRNQYTAGQGADDEVGA